MKGIDSAKPFSPLYLNISEQLFCTKTDTIYLQYLKKVCLIYARLLVFIHGLTRLIIAYTHKTFSDFFSV